MDITDLSDEEVNALTEAIHKRYGLDFTCYELKSLKRRILRILHLYKLQSSHELWQKVLREKEFIQVLINEISVGLTAMFRDPELWAYLRDVVLPPLANRPAIRIWHAGCSTGEEIYTMAIVLKEVGLLSKAKALATDMNSEALQASEKGEYHKIKMIEYGRNYAQYQPKKDFQEYCSLDANHYVAKPYLRAHVKFTLHNLVTEPIQGKYDIIFCRNVMIYFDQATKERLLHAFHQALYPGGYFIIGFFDSIVSLIDKEKFSFENPGLRVYKKVASKMIEVG
ncbi:protein-glutamate O-methyltransferase CheR [Cytophagales bacterium LB-30]|uniref:Protein-glutamate O-methyltransferase CheR n=1 Tax=Shiella aurantiaca TaxID=3058365 RepID=A0ABT8F6B2_9BACT|nr:protein-glutamate O-methyltransferase CheR [Shiella aurantiaca]MDN4165908.1 protein-glutamate O-methyltransferase CheR [Shiella aurantiaca]